MRVLRTLLGAVAVAALMVAGLAGGARAATRTVVPTGTGHITSSKVGGAVIADPEFRGEAEDGNGPSGGHHNGPPNPNRPFGRQKKLFPGQTLPAPDVASRAIAPAQTGFDGLRMFDQRYANGGNQFSVDPPDQALCVGGGRVLEAVNTVVAVYSTAGQTLLGPQDLNTFYGYPDQFNRSTGESGPVITDPVCYFDPEHQRFVLVVLTLDADPATGDFTGTNHLDVAVSASADPAGAWRRYSFAVQDDGSADTPRHHNCPCIGDYPHIGADANGVYITTNEYSFFGSGYNGAQIYALPKAQLYGGGAVDVTQVENTSLAGSRGFTLAPATSNPGDYETAAEGTEYFLSTIAGDGSETGNPTGSADKIGVWALTGTATLADKNPKLRLASAVVPTEAYVFPPLSNQKAGPFPLGQCLNDASSRFGPGLGCWALLLDQEPAHDETLETPDSADTREFQVWYANGRLHGAAGTAVNPAGDDTTRAGIAWWSVMPSLRVTGAKAHLTASIANQGYLGSRGQNLTYPAWAVRRDGRGAIAFSVMGTDWYPSAGYALWDGTGFGSVRLAAVGSGPADNFTAYKALVGDPPTPRWGDYGAAVTDGDSVWLASEYIGQVCTLDQWIADPTCGRTRAALGNWYTHISRVTP